MGGRDLEIDLGKKKHVYAEAGIPEYWVANLKSSQLHVFQDLVNGIYQTELTLTDGTVSPLAVPKIVISVRRLFS